MNAFEIVARHYAEKASIKLTFKDKCSPSTDGKSKIILPKCMNEDKLLATIAALLHEAHHIKLTGDIELACQRIYREGQAKHWFGNIGSYQLNNFYQFLLNLCEDIRIDNKVLSKYEGAKYIYQELIDLANNIRKEDKQISDHTNKFIVLTQQIWLYALEFDESNYFAPEIIKDFISKKKEKLDIILADVKSANAVFNLVRPVDQLGKLIKDYLQMKDEKQPGEGNKEATKKLKEKLKEKLQEQKKESSDLEKSKEKLKKEKEDISDEIGDTNKNRSKMQEKKNKLPADERDKLEEKIEKSYDEEKELRKKKDAAEKKLRKLYKEKQEVESEARETEEDIETIVEAKGDLSSEDIIDIEIEDPSGYSLNGFEQLNKATKLMGANYEDMLSFESNLNAIFKRLEHKETYNNNTGKLNLKSIHKIFNHEGDIDDIFRYDKLTEKFSNKIIFLLDVSGSMGSYAGGGHKNKIVWDCLMNMVKVIEANKEACSIEYGIYTFASRSQFGEVKAFEDESVTETSLAKKYRENYFGGGTAICDALENCYDVFEDKSHNKDKKFIICITDAEFGYSDMNTILKEYDARQEKHIFIGINSRDYVDETSRFFKEILMGRMVNSVKEMEATLIESFDRIL